ncbi:hypothetical protein T484DRAFT_1786614 [Baffinella frigidus]|nr:hypothetical protein T484DRAFT_1786614 [Cryptophyta sp. CCMP2293]
MASPSQREHGYYSSRDALPALAPHERRLGSKAPPNSDVARRAGNIGAPRRNQALALVRASQPSIPRALPHAEPHGDEGIRSNRSPYTNAPYTMRGAHLSKLNGGNSSFISKPNGGGSPFMRAGSLEPFGPERAHEPLSRVPPLHRRHESHARDERGGLCNSGRGWDRSLANHAAAWAQKESEARSASEAGDCLAGEEESSVSEIR